MASDLRRAAATAAELSAVSGLPVAHDAALRETYAGAWQGLTHEEIIERYGEQYAAWKRGEPVRRGGGELETEVADRAAPVVLEHADKLPENGTLVVVSHGGTIRTTIVAARPGSTPLGRARRAVQLLLVRPRGRRTGLAPAGAQRRARCRSRCSATTTEGPPTDQNRKRPDEGRTVPGRPDRRLCQRC